jgi:hypothetical protein
LARELGGYRGEKRLDFLARFNGRIVLGEAKFLTDRGGHQDRQFDDAKKLVEEANEHAVRVAICDGVIYIKPRRMPGPAAFQYLQASNSNILSALVLREFLFSL